MEEKGRWSGISGDPAFTLWRILDHARFMIARSREKELSAYGLTPEQSHVLDVLMESGGSTTINQLVQITQRQHHSISTLIDRMTKQGLVSKSKGGSDKRRYEVAITTKGRELARRMSRHSIEEIFSCLSPEEMTEMRDGLRRLTRRAYDVLHLDPSEHERDGNRD